MRRSAIHAVRQIMAKPIHARRAIHWGALQNAPLCVTIDAESEGFLWLKFFSSATARFDPGTAYPAMQCYTTLCNGFAPFVLLTYYF